MQFSQTQKLEIRDNGYTVVRGAVPGVMVREAVRAINHSLGKGVPPDEVATYAAQSYCPDVKTTPVITDLFNATPLYSLMESVLGEGRFAPATGGQIALRFPTMKDPPAAARPHLDGIHSPTNGVPEGKLHNFTALVGVLLSDLPEGNAGNFTAWPGSHQKYAEYFREHGTEGLTGGAPKIDLPAPHQITGRAGDAVVCHYQLGHGITANTSPNIRYAVFFRVRHHEHDSHSWEVLTDLWRDWPGVRELEGS